jgi:hypothetical protein
MELSKKFSRYAVFLSLSSTLLLSSLAHTNSAIAKPAKTSTTRSDVQRDVEGYAISSCLMNLKQKVGIISAQDTAFLNQQGQHGVNIIIQRGEGDVETLFMVGRLVQATMATMPVTQVQGDGPMDERSHHAAIFYCAEIIDVPKVRASIDTAIAKLRSAYKK